MLQMAHHQSIVVQFAVVHATRLLNSTRIQKQLEVSVPVTQTLWEAVLLVVN